MHHLSSPPTFTEPQGGASLLLAFRALPQRAVLILGRDQIAASRAFSALEANYNAVIMTPGGRASVCEELAWRADHAQLAIVDSGAQPGTSPRLTDTPTPMSGEGEAHALASYLDRNLSINLVFVTDTVLGGSSVWRRSRASAEQIYGVCRARRVPVNVTDMPDLCDFTLPSVHRVPGTPLQLAVTTNGQGCRLGARIRREVVARLPRDTGMAVARVGELRRLARDSGEADNEHQSPTPNTPVSQWSATEEETDAERSMRRMRWVAQISEYWSYSHLANLTQEGMENVLNGNGLGVPFDALKNCELEPGSRHGLAIAPSQPHGKIFLVGSGPGHPGLLTMATHDILTKQADLVLSDKLVPEAVLALIPKHVEVRIARKFPGNADGAQQEIMEAAVDAASHGLSVVRLKQGDPTVYGRMGEEILYFRERGFESVVIPGISSALAGPVCAGIPVTQRGAAESFIVCTGVGRQGQDVVLPGYDRARTLVILMGVARIAQVLETLVTPVPTSRRNGPPYPTHMPIAIIERASMPDQRTITSTLAHVTTALESSGTQRPPGMIVVGWSILSLWGVGDITILNKSAEQEDESRIERWLDGQSWRVTEGFSGDWVESTSTSI
ncbi:tetrapyrrole methylase [Multifurca ochricompacta]|uniref:precorrin-2 dehydrogenase n=1 Tax=Multifurca ochricompacta TaxID=376703 RepID=A0AAD4QJ97_9AGAM|nr:tetrapyrrole methylase [Multifurca ochricompacta]